MPGDQKGRNSEGRRIEQREEREIFRERRPHYPEPAQNERVEKRIANTRRIARQVAVAESVTLCKRFGER